MQFAYEIVEFGTGRVLGGDLSQPGKFGSAEEFMTIERAELEKLARPGQTFTLREISVEQYKREQLPQE
jgi:hypothetical protein